MRITKVYTRTGDKGSTRLVGGEETSKDAARVEAYGTVDELNAVMGLVRLFHREHLGDTVLQPMFGTIQNDLFNVGTELATPPDSRWEGMYRVSDDDVTKVEHWIDELNEDLGPLTEFILPGGGYVGAFLHQARTVCRRAERRVVSIGDLAEVDGCLRYLNRLSDFFFVAGRWAARAANEPETTWENPNRRS